MLSHEGKPVPADYPTMQEAKGIAASDPRPQFNKGAGPDRERKGGRLSPEAQAQVMQMVKEKRAAGHVVEKEDLMRRLEEARRHLGK
jgi:hypothetical protein